MEKIKFIRGVEGRGAEIWKLLVKSGAVNDSNWENLHIDLPDWLFFIDQDNHINAQNTKTALAMLLMEHGEEMFLEPQYKYKVGDKVMYCSELNPTTPRWVCKLINDKGKPYYDLKKGGAFSYVSEEDITPYVETQVKTWEDLICKEIKGCYIGRDSRCLEIHGNYTCSAGDKNVAASEKVAKSMLAMAQISQLMPYYGNEVTDEEWASSSDIKYIIENVKGRIEKHDFIGVYHFLAFHTPEQRDEFLRNNEQLVRDYLMIKNNDSENNQEP